MSAEAVIGTGITVAAIGVLFLMLGLAQQLRDVKGAALILFAIGMVLLVLGVVATMMARTGKRRS